MFLGISENYMQSLTIETTMLLLEKHRFQHCIFHCTSIIPLSPEKVDIHLKVRSTTNCCSEKWMATLRTPWEKYYLPPSFLKDLDMSHILLHRLKTRNTKQCSYFSSMHWLPTIEKLRHNNSPSTGDTEMPVDKCIPPQHTFFHTGCFLK